MFDTNDRDYDSGDSEDGGAGDAARTVLMLTLLSAHGAYSRKLLITNHSKIV